MNGDDVLSAAEAAELLGVDEEWINARKYRGPCSMRLRDRSVTIIRRDLARWAEMVAAEPRGAPRRARVVAGSGGVPATIEGRGSQLRRPVEMAVMSTIRNILMGRPAERYRYEPGTVEVEDEEGNVKLRRATPDEREYARRVIEHIERPGRTAARTPVDWRARS